MADSPDEIGSLERARQKLYTANASPTTIQPGLHASEESSLSREWKTDAPKGKSPSRHFHFAKRFFFFALAFFFIAGGTAALLFFTGSNTVSVDNVSISVQGPTTVAGGDMAPLSITITNRNPVAIDNAVLEITFPEGTRSAEDVTKSYQRYVEELGSLPSGATVERSVKAVLFGTQGTAVTIPILVSYGTTGSNATFVKRSIYPITVSTAPLSVSVDSISETVSGKPLTISATVRSNATTPISDVVLGAQYPTGFLLTNSSVSPIGSNFLLGVLEPGESKVITITGTLTGQNNEERVFRFTVGTAKAPREPTIAISYMTQEAKVTIAAPFLATAITINGSSASSPVLAPGTTVTVQVSWTNTLLVPINNADVSVKLSGAAFDPASVQTNNGFYRSLDRTVVFNRDTDPNLASLPPGASGAGSFAFVILPNAPRSSSVTLALSIAGERVGQDNVPQEVSMTGSKTIKVASVVALTSVAAHFSGPFTNPGPVPPVADQQTSYTITWTLANSGNDLADTAVTATLPSYVIFTGLTSPPDGSLTYDASSRKVSWKSGDVGAGSTKQQSFQVAITPSISQRGFAPPLTSALTLSGFDRFAQVAITAQGSAATTETKGDPGYVPQNAIVQ